MGRGTGEVNNFHLPLPPGLYHALREEARRAGMPATALAREAIRRWIEARRRAGLRDEIAAWAEEEAGTPADLDEDLEAAAVEALREGR